ncbi:MAG: MoaD/ThiS family protein [Xylophilus ampelinus]
MPAPAARRIAVRYFASIREAIGAEGEALSTAAATAGALRDELIARGGAHAAALDRARPVRIAVDRAMAPESQPLAEGAEVAFFPPVTGG